MCVCVCVGGCQQYSILGSCPVIISCLAFQAAQYLLVSSLFVFSFAFVCLLVLFLNAVSDIFSELVLVLADR